MMTPRQRERDPETSAALTARLLYSGFVPGVPLQVTPEAADIDRRICEHETCPNCGHAGLLAQPFRRGGSYVVVMACPACPFGQSF